MITESLVILATQINIDLQVIDLGGGLGIPYYNQDIRLDVKDVSNALNKLKRQFPEINFWLELGRYAVGECGVYTTEIIDKKDIHDKTLLILDGGSNHLIRPFVTNQFFPVTNLRKDNDLCGNTLMELHGPLCTSIDHLGSINLPTITSSGDTLVFKQVGAYGFTESMPFFLCHTLPAEIVYKQQQVVMVRKPQKADSWLV
jgi:diaminopimelate decarboxylase